MGYGRISAQPLRLADPWARTNPHPFRRCNSPAAAGLPWNAMECHGRMSMDSPAYKTDVFRNLKYLKYRKSDEI